MLNVVGPTDDRTKRTQARIDRIAEPTSRMRGRAPRSRSAGPRGLEQLGGGEVRGSWSRRPAARPSSARSGRSARPDDRLASSSGAAPIRGSSTGRRRPPIRQGRATMTVTHLYVSAIRGIRGSAASGAPSRGPNARITPKQLEEDFLPVAAADRALPGHGRPVRTRPARSRLTTAAPGRGSGDRADPLHDAGEPVGVQRALRRQ